MSHTVDASVLVSALRPGDINHAASAEYLDRFEAAGEEAIEPALVITECSGAIARAAADSSVGHRAALAVRALVNYTFVPLTVERAEDAGKLAADQRLRGADAIYVALAQEFGTILITWDSEMLARTRAAATTITPTDWLIANPT